MRRDFGSISAALVFCGEGLLLVDTERGCAATLAQLAAVSIRKWALEKCGERGDACRRHAPLPLNGWLRLALSDEHVNRALRIRARGLLDWDDLQRLIEIIQTGSGGSPGSIPGAPSERELGRLSQTANSVFALDDRSRHPGRIYDPPIQPMALPEAQSIVDVLLASWLKNISPNP